MKLGVLSDTHWRDASHIDGRIYDIFKDVEAILHAGDVTDISVIEAFSAFRPVYGVCGNCDGNDVRTDLPDKRCINADGCRIGIIHGWRRDLAYLGDLKREFNGVDIVVFGHSHVPAMEMRDGVLFFNPGSATYPRSDSASVGILEIGPRIKAYHIAL